MSRELIVSGALAGTMQAHGVPGGEASKTAHHEWQHANEDTEGFGVFGLILVPALLEFQQRVDGFLMTFREEIEVVAAAFYRPEGERTPETMAAIASAPGFSEMSEQDWAVYTRAKADSASQLFGGEVVVGEEDKGIVFQDDEEDMEQTK